MTTHFFTVDVEEHYQVVALAPYVPRDQWSSQESRVERNTMRILELCEKHSARGTFFVVGCVAEAHPSLIKAIAAGGHELASHTWDHRRIPDQEREAFRVSVRRTRQVLEDISGTPCVGFRAPSYSIVPGTEWALDILVEEGYRYDSSLFPVTRRGYGYPGAARDPWVMKRPPGFLTEFPPATLRRLGMNLPAAGGAYFRLLPYGLVAAALRDASARNQPGCFYIHPWEIDPGQPRYPVSLLTGIRHYGRLAGVAARLDRLLGEFSFTSIESRLGLWAHAA